MKEQTGRIPRRLTVKLLAFLLTCGMFLSMNAEAFAASVSDSDAPEQAAVSQSDAPAQTVIKDRQETAPKKSTTATASGQCGDNLTWEYDDSTYTLTIRGSGHMWNFRGERPWRSYQSSIESIVFDGNITSITGYAFCDFESLKNISIPDTVTSIGENAFAHCRSLKNINIPDSVTSIGWGAFEDCSSLTTVVLSDSITTIENNTFYNCGSLTSVNIPDSLTSIGDSAFCGCASLTSITIPDSVTSIGYQAFSNCFGLESVVLPNAISTLSGGVFYHCTSLTSISIPKSVETIESGAFEACTDLTSVTMPKPPASYIKMENFFIYPFNSCPVRDVYFGGTQAEWTTYEGFENATVHYGLMGTKENYQVFFDQDTEGLSSAEIVFNTDIKTISLDDSHRITVYQRQNYTDSDNDNYHEKVLFRISSADDPRLTVGTDRISVDLSALPEDCTASIALDNDTITLTDNTVALITKGNREVCRYTHRPEVTANVSFASDGDKAKENNGDLDHSFRYSDKFFYYDNTDYHNDLAVMSLGLELTSWSKSAYSNGNYYTKKLDYYTRAQNLINMYNQLMVVDREYHNYDIPLSDNKDKVAYSLGLKYIQDSEGNTDTLIVLPVRGGGYGAEWASNFRVEGNSGNHYGFQLAAGDIYSSLQAYLKKLEKTDRIKGKLKLWTVGYSRGAAVANLLVHIVNKNELVDFENVYAYTFATPQGYYKKGSNSVNDDNMFNIVSANDLVPKLALSEWGFDRYGQSVILPNYTPDKVASEFKMLTGEEFKADNNYDAENKLLDALTKIAKDRYEFSSDVQPSVVQSFANGYSKKNGSLVVCFLSGLAASTYQQPEKYKVLIASGLLKRAAKPMTIRAYEDMISDYEWGAAVSDLLTVDKCHYAEHYLSWLETGGEYKVADASSYANFTATKKTAIETFIKTKANESCQRLHLKLKGSIKVFDLDGNTVLSINNGNVEAAEIPCSVDGDSVSFYTAGEGYTVQATGSGDGTMDCTVTKYNNKGEQTQTVNYNGLTMTNGQVYTAEVSETGEDSTLSTNGETVKPSYDSQHTTGSRYSITVNNGASFVESAYSGEYVSIGALPQQGKLFSGWKADGDDVRFTDSEAQSTTFIMPQRNVTIEAVWEDDPDYIPFVITRQPQDVSVSSSDQGDISFSVTVEGNEPAYQWYVRQTDADDWSVMEGKTSETLTLSAGEVSDGMQFCCVITNNRGDVLVSESAMVVTGKVLQITSQPEDQCIHLGDSVTVSLEADGDEVTYQWYFKKAGASDWSIWNNHTHASETATPNASWNGIQLYCAVSDKRGKTIHSDVVTVTFTSNLKITSQPSDQSMKLGESVTLSITAEGEGLSYQWYFKKAGAYDWSIWKGHTHASETCTPNATWNGIQLYCVVKDTFGNTVESQPATVTFISDFRITRQPSDQSIALGESTTLSIETEGSGLSYQWYFKKSGQLGWTKWNNRTHDGIQLYCEVTDELGNILKSDPATVTFVSNLKITKQPADHSIQLGESITLLLTAEGSGLSYQWYFKKAGQLGWTKWNNRTHASETVTPNASWDGIQLYCTVTDGLGNKVDSQPATVTITQELKITKQPTSQSIVLGKTLTLSLTATGDSLTYQWYFKKKGQTSFSVWNGHTKATETAAPNATWDGIQLYCKVTDGSGNSVSSNTVTVSVLSITTQPGNVTVAAGSSATFKVKATGSGLTYQWQYKKSGATSWSNWNGRTTASTTATANSSWNGMQVRCIVTDGAGNKVTSSTATVTIK